MPLNTQDGLSAELLALLGEADFVKLCQEFGGTRLYVPRSTSGKTDLVKAIGSEAARKMMAAFGSNALRIPLAREKRALYYREKGLSHAQIARKIGITENGVLKLLKRLTD